MQYGLHSPLPGSSGANRFASDRAAMLGPSISCDGGSPGAGPSPSAAKRLSHLSGAGPAPHVAAAGPSASAAAAAARAHASSPGSPLRPSLKVALPADSPEPEFFAGGSGGGDGICYSPSTPAAKSGMKERMKFYFQRQAGL
jgi:hypothetical protein